MWERGILMRLTFSATEPRTLSLKSAIVSTRALDEESSEADPEMGELCDEDDAEMVAPFDPDKEGEATSAIAHAATPMKRAGSTGSLRGTDKKAQRTDAPLEQPNPHPLGTSQHWIWEMKFELCLDGCLLKHPFNQATILLPKLPQEERDNVNKRMEQCRQAMEINYLVIGEMSDKDCASVHGGYFYTHKT